MPHFGGRGLGAIMATGGSGGWCKLGLRPSPFRSSPEATGARAIVTLSALGEPFRADDRCRPTKASLDASQTWHLDEVYRKIDGRMVYLLAGRRRRGEVLDVLIQSKRNKHAALKLMRKLLKKYAFAPERLVTDDLRSYSATARELGIERRHERGRWKNNRAENSHQPTRRRERKMQRFKSPGVSQEISFRTRRRLQHLQCSTPSRLSSNASHVSR